VTEAKTRLLAFLEEEKQRNFVRVIYVPVGLIPRLIGMKGGNIREIQQDTETKIDLDKETERGTIRGTEAACNAAVKAIQNYFDTEGIDLDILTLPPPVSEKPAPEETTAVVEEVEEAETSPIDSSKQRVSFKLLAVLMSNDYWLIDSYHRVLKRSSEQLLRTRA
jgi:polyribonucleotide nucleotidyltransferase